MPEESTPRLSIVVPVRDPAYGGGLLHRLQVSLDAFLTLARRYDLHCEVVIVEWNPVPGAPRFHELLSWPSSLAPALLRFIEVPGSIHARLPGALHRPIHSATARNVGVRRARGEYVLVTGADTVPSEALGRFLAQAHLSEDTFYRVDRRDLSAPLPAAEPLRRQLGRCRRQAVTVHTYYGSIREPRGWSPVARVATRRRHSRVLERYRRLQVDPGSLPRVEGLGTDRLIAPADGLHRNGAGDFFLMHRRHWHELRGYTELPTRGHTDSILCWTAASAGLAQLILEHPIRLYHQQHDREDAADWPVTDWRPWYERYVACRGSGTPLIVNGDDWGLSEDVLPESTFADTMPT